MKIPTNTNIYAPMHLIAASRLPILLPALFLFALTASNCVYKSDVPDITGRDIHITFLHTSDIHSRILPYQHVPMYTERQLGMVEGRENYGGIARVAHIVNREREKAGRSLYLDSGDLFQGAPIFNHFHGEAEIRALSHAGVDVFCLGNHEFDRGAENVARQFEAWADFPILAANYEFQLAEQPFGSQFAHLVKPFVVFNLSGVKVGIIGMGNLSSMTSLDDGGNSVGIIPLESVQIVQDYVSLLRDSVDVVVLLSHLGLSHDEYLGRNICGLDLIFGGHHHIALNPPKIIPYDPDPEVVQGEDDETNYGGENQRRILRSSKPICSPEHKRDAILVHPNAFAKFVARFDVVVRDGRIRSHKFKLFPVDSSVPEDPNVSYVLDEYVEELNRVYSLDRVVVNAKEKLTRFGARGGDSMLGNLVAEAMQFRKYVETDFCITNSLGVRTDILQGPITYEQMYNVLPFDNTIATLFLSGIEVQETLDYATGRSADRGCSSQIQVSNIEFVMNCRTGKAEDIVIAGEPLRHDSVYEMCTNNYMAWGGSGFRMLKRNTTKNDTGISMRDAVIDYMRQVGDIPYCSNGDSIENCTEGVGIEDGRISPKF